MTNPSDPDPERCTLSNGELQLLARVDERTERMDEKIDDVVESTNENAEDIAENSQNIKRNATILGGYSAGLMAVLMWSADKISTII